MLYSDSSSISAALQPRLRHWAVASSFVIVGLIAAPAIARDAIQVPQDYALKQEVEIEVTPIGLVLDIHSPITSAYLSHMSDVVFIGLDGVLCDPKAECPEDAPQPTTLLLRRIPPITFRNQLPSADGKRMLFITTKEGLHYRFRIKPATSPDYTLIEIQPNTTNALPGFAPYQTPMSR